MEQDNVMKEILRNSAAQTAAGFTDAVMKKVHGVSVAPAAYKPLAPPKAVRVFLLLFSGLAAAIIALCVLAGLPRLSLETYIQNTALPQINYGRIIICICIFWTLFVANALLQKQYALRKTMA